MGRINNAALEGRYPGSPGYKAPGPSAEAARKVAPAAKTLRDEVLKEYDAAGLGGLTADQVASRLGKSVLAIRPRVSELVAQGKLVDTRERRINDSGLKATVYRIVSAGDLFGL